MQCRESRTMRNARAAAIFPRRMTAPPGHLASALADRYRIERELGADGATRDLSGSYRER